LKIRSECLDLYGLGWGGGGEELVDTFFTFFFNVNTPKSLYSVSCALNSSALDNLCWNIYVIIRV